MTENKLTKDMGFGKIVGAGHVDKPRKSGMIVLADICHCHVAQQQFT